MRYVVTKNFMDKHTREYYSIGEIYETENEKRAQDLENGGYIAPENTEAAQAAQAAQAVNQNATVDQQLQQQLQKEVEPYTVLNGEFTPLKEALKIEEMKEENINTTGIRQEHDNSTEPVKAGAKAKGKAQGKAQGKEVGKPAALKQSNQQSGQVTQSSQSSQSTEAAENISQALESKGQQFNQAAQLDQHQEAAPKAARAKNK